MLLITHQPTWLGKGNDRDSDAAAIELGVLLPHLAEVRLARQSSQVPQKNQQQIIVEEGEQFSRLAVKIKQRQFFYRNIFQFEKTRVDYQRCRFAR